MENLKIKVNSKAESKEVQGLFDKFDLVCETWSSNMQLPFFICNWIDGEYSNYSLQDLGLNHLKESSIQRLQDMVVLKRNDCKDRTHVDSNNYDWYVASDEKHYRHQGSVWVHQPYVDCLELKLIQKEKTMKEWIYQDGSGEYVLTTDPEVANFAADAVEVPVGADTLAGDVRGGCQYFWDHNKMMIIGCSESLDRYPIWEPIEDSASDWLKIIGGSHFKMLWQRNPNQEAVEEKTPMEEVLEFAEELRNMGESGWSKEKHSHYKRDVSHLNTIDPYRIADLYDLHPCAEHIMKKSLCAGNRGHKDLLRDIQDIIDTAERWKEMIEEDNREI